MMQKHIRRSATDQASRQNNMHHLSPHARFANYGRHFDAVNAARDQDRFVAALRRVLIPLTLITIGSLVVWYA